MFSKASKSNGSVCAGGSGAGEWAWDRGCDTGFEPADNRSPSSPYWSQNVPWLERDDADVAALLRLPRFSQKAPSASNCFLCASSLRRRSSAIAACFCAMVMSLAGSAGRAAGMARRLEKASLCAGAGAGAGAVAGGLAGGGAGVGGFAAGCGGGRASSSKAGWGLRAGGGGLADQLRSSRSSIVHVESVSQCCTDLRYNK